MTVWDPALCAPNETRATVFHFPINTSEYFQSRFQTPGVCGSRNLFDLGRPQCIHAVKWAWGMPSLW